MHAGSLAPFEVDLKLWPKEQCFEAAVSMLKCLGIEMILHMILSLPFACSDVVEAHMLMVAVKQTHGTERVHECFALIYGTTICGVCVCVCLFVAQQLPQFIGDYLCSACYTECHQSL